MPNMPWQTLIERAILLDPPEGGCQVLADVGGEGVGLQHLKVVAHHLKSALALLLYREMFARCK